MAKRTPEELFKDIQLPQYTNALRVAATAKFNRNAEDFGFRTLEEAQESYAENDERWVEGLIKQWKSVINMGLRHHLEQIKAGEIPLPTDTSYINTLPDFDVNAVPLRVTARQAREALIRQSIVDGDDKIATIETYISNIVDVNERALANNYWERSQDFERNNVLLVTIATDALGYTSIETDDLFKYAQTL